MSIICDRQTLRAYLNDQLEEDDRLDFLFHLDGCPNCWNSIYSAVKAGHPEFYKRAPKKSKLLEEIKGFDKTKNSSEEEIIEVA